MPPPGDRPLRMLQASSFFDLLEIRCATTPDARFLDFEGRMLTPRQLDAESRALARGLRSMGVTKGDRVATLLGNGPEIVVAVVAAWRLGAIVVPLNTAHRATFLSHPLRDSGAQVLVTDAGLAPRVADVIGEAPELRTIVLVPAGTGATNGAAAAWPSQVDVRTWSDLFGEVRSDEPIRRPAPRANDVAAIFYTGGTTGPSKGCMLSYGYMVNAARRMVDSDGRNSQDVLLTPLPLFHVNVWVVGILGALLTDSRLSVSRRFSVSGFWAEVERSEATIVSLLGTLAALIASAPGEPSASCRLSRLIAVPVVPETERILRDRFGLQLASAGYGMTEAMPISILPSGMSNKPGAAAPANAADFEVMIVDDVGNPVPPDVIGEITCRARRPDVLFTGYWPNADPELSAGRAWFHTGDLGKLDADGFLYFVDRKQDYIRRRGENVSSQEIEAVFLGHSAIEDVAVHAVPSPQGEDDIKATVVLRAGARLAPRALCDWCVAFLPYYAVPRYFEFRDELPRSEVGRVLKTTLRQEGVTATTWDRESEGYTVERS